MFGLSNSKKTLAISSILLLCVGCVRGSHSKEVDYSIANEKTDYGSKLESSEANLSSELSAYDGNNKQFGMKVQNKSGSWWGGLMKIISGNKLISSLILLAFVLGMVAMFGNFTGMHQDAGKMIFGDNGSSMWLRLAIVIPCLTLSIGAFTVVSFRARKRDAFDSSDISEYQNWKSEGHGIGKDKTSRLLQYFFCGGLLILALVNGIAGGANNWGETMHIFSWCLPLCFGLAGLVAIGTRHYHQNKMKKATASFNGKINYFKGRYEESNKMFEEQRKETEDCKAKIKSINHERQYKARTIRKLNEQIQAERNQKAKDTKDLEKRLRAELEEEKTLFKNTLMKQNKKKEKYYENEKKQFVQKKLPEGIQLMTKKEQDALIEELKKPYVLDTELSQIKNKPIKN